MIDLFDFVLISIFVFVAGFFCGELHGALIASGAGGKLMQYLEPLSRAEGIELATGADASYPAPASAAAPTHQGVARISKDALADPDRTLPPGAQARRPCAICARLRSILTGRA